jgi:hypothetical protein
MKLAIAVMFGVLCCLPAKAQTVYQYLGNDGINGTFTLFGPQIVSTMPIAVDPLAYFFTTGNTIFDQANSTAYFYIGTTASGAVDNWWVDIGNGTNSFFSEFYGSGTEATDAIQANGVDTAYLGGDAGKWLITSEPQSNTVVPTPEPSEWLEIAIGFGALIIGAKYRLRERRT